HYFDDTIENIFFIDKTTYRTDKKRTINTKIRIGVSTQIFTHKQSVSILRKNIPQATVGEKEYSNWRNRIFSDLGQGILFEDYIYYIPLFFDNSQVIFDYLDKDNSWIHFLSIPTNHSLKKQLNREYSLHAKDKPLPSPDNLYDFDYKKYLKQFNHLEIKEFKSKDIYRTSLKNTIRLELQSIGELVGNLNFTALSQTEEMLSFIGDFFKREGNVIFIYHSKSLKEEINHFLQSREFNEMRSRIHFVKSSIEHGFFYPMDKLLFLGCEDLFRRKKQKTKKMASKKIDLFAEQLTSLSINDYIMHKIYGLGKFLGLKPLETDGNKTDYMVVEYKDGDKVYVPVYKMDQVQKHANADAHLNLDNLKKNKYRLAKQRASQAAKKLAFDLIKLQADRKCTKAYAFSPPDDNYSEFEKSFPFQETPDQLHAIHNVLTDMQKDVPMDHLVCGDVGFGKTEVAIRAAFKAVLDGKQVAILVPTTLLSLQHYHTLKKRFEKFPVVVDFISRIKSSAEEKRIKQQLKEG
ncbi:MAG: DEAD/DEAH box helicase, partial [Halobacteriovoraceae bacterium]|nr:DEAD/DEAH box helicase [Halobacteriovoraceae bacterium]